MLREEMERVKIINIAEDCLKAFKRYVGFLNCEDYITLEEINQTVRQFKRAYEALIDLVPETPKKLGCLFRYIRFASNSVVVTANSLTYYQSEYSKRDLEENIEVIEEEIFRLKSLEQKKKG